MKPVLALALVASLIGAGPDTGMCQSPVSPPFVSTLDLRLDGPLAHQWMSLRPLAVPFTETAQGSLSATIRSSLLFGALGGFCGGFVGLTLGSVGSGEWDAVVGAVFGIVGGAGIGAGWGAHIGNGHRGSLGLDLLGGIIGAGFSAISGHFISESGEVLWLHFIVPTVTLPVIAERLSAGARYRRRKVEASVGPAPGGFALTLRASF